jgi:hypothetical protein
VTPGIVEGHIGMTFENDLLFNNIENGDQGVYTCKASNINGEASNFTRVEVISKLFIKHYIIM